MECLYQLPSSYPHAGHQGLSLREDVGLCGGGQVDPAPQLVLEAGGCCQEVETIGCSETEMLNMTITRLSLIHILGVTTVYRLHCTAVSTPTTFLEAEYHAM